MYEYITGGNMAKKKRRKSLRRRRKQLPVFIVVILVLVFVAGLMIGIYKYANGELDFGGSNKGGTADNSSRNDDDNVVVASEGDLEIHFLELGNKYTGDCTYIRAGDNDILIDAGSKASSIPTIDKYLKQFVTDGTLEYVIVTHAHQDHYAGFATGEKTDSLFDLYECEIIIDFAQVEAGKQDTTMYKNYVRERDAEIAAGATHYTARECMEQKKNIFDLGDGVELEILDSYFYYNASNDENNHSVCTLIRDGSNNYLFTGDLEKEGEEKLVEMNDLPKVKLYKAGHHGSKTSSGEALLEKIRPDVVCVCCCAGSPEYTTKNANQFPTQDFINRIAPYTEYVFVTTLCVDYENDKYTSMNGNIRMISKQGEITMHFSGHSQKLKDTDWFKQNRTVPAAWK